MPVSAAQTPEIDEAEDLDAVDLDAGKPRRRGIAADRLDLLAERGALDEEPERRRAPATMMTMLFGMPKSQRPSESCRNASGTPATIGTPAE